MVRRPRHLRRPAGPRVLRDEGERRRVALRPPRMAATTFPSPPPSPSQVNEEISVKHLPASEPDPHVVRVGWSLDSCSTQLGKSARFGAENLFFSSPFRLTRPLSARSGEEPFSYGYGGTGKKSTNCKFENYGETFAENDVIACLVVSPAPPAAAGGRLVVLGLHPAPSRPAAGL